MVQVKSLSFMIGNNFEITDFRETLPWRHFDLELASTVDEWDEQEQTLRAKVSCPTSVSGLTNTQSECAKNFTDSLKSFSKEGGCYSHKGHVENHFCLRAIHLE